MRRITRALSRLLAVAPPEPLLMHPAGLVMSGDPGPSPLTLGCPVMHQQRGCPVQPPPPLDATLIRQSLAQMTATHRTAGDFYGYLFAAHPRLRDMFPPQMDAQNERLFAALLHIVKLLDRPDTLSRYLSQLGVDHRKYGVQPEHYAPVGAALIAALRRHSPVWAPEIETAWKAAYDTAAQAMIAAASMVTGPACWTGHVVRHEMRARDLAVLSVRTDQPLPYEAGQYVTVQTAKWQRVWRPFSIANAPGPDGLIDLHVRAVPGGWVSTALVKDTGPDDQLLIGPAMGTMTPTAVAAGRDLLCVAGGTGLAPIKALVEAVVAGDEQAVSERRGMRRSICLFHGARTPLDLYAAPEMRHLEDTYPWVQFLPVVSRGGFGGLTGPVPDVAAQFSDWAGREAFVSGPPRMVQHTAQALAAAGIPADRVHYDATELGIGDG